MWIAKPIRELDIDEQSAWSSLLRRAQARGDEAPLAQTLPWARAIEAVSGRAYAVFSPDESAGGLVFAVADPATRGALFECVNGPLLAWDDPVAAPRQLATFATAVSRLHSRFQSLALRPRWLEGRSASRLALLPASPCAETRATTLKLDLAQGAEAAEQRFHPRLRRTLAATIRAGVDVAWQETSAAEIAGFAPRMAYFGRARGFAVPPVAWFLALTLTASGADRLRFGIVRARAPGTECELLVALHGAEAHYLFGHESRAPGARGAVSAAAAAHRFVVRMAADAGLRTYDLNGYVEAPASGHPYASIARFKAQFGGEVVRYEVPELRIEK